MIAPANTIETTTKPIKCIIIENVLLSERSEEGII